MGWSKREIIRKAFGELGLGSYALDASPSELQDAMQMLDALMARWTDRGIVFDTIYPQPASIDTGDLDDDSNVPSYASEAVYLNLALRIAPGFGKTPSPDTKRDARRAYSDVLAKFVVGTEVSLKGLPRGAGAKDPLEPFFEV